MSPAPDHAGSALAAAVLALDCAAVAAAYGLAFPERPGRILARLLPAFAGFQAGLYLLGGSLGAGARGFLQPWDHWLAFALLAAIGIGMLRGASGDRGIPAEPGLRTVLVLGLATGVDALAVGLGRSLAGDALIASALWVGAAATALPAAVFLMASRLGRSLGSWAERAGGLCLIGIGARILAEHLRAGN